MNSKDIFLPSIALALIACPLFSVSASAQTTIERIYEHRAPGAIIQENYATVNVRPKIIEQPVIMSPPVDINVIPGPTLALRSNYSKRLGDILEQLSTAYQRGWLSERQYADLKTWEAQVAMEELLLRQKGNGIVPRADVEQMERHLNGLAYTVNQQIDQGSKMARVEDNGL